MLVSLDSAESLRLLVTEKTLFQTLLFTKRHSPSSSPTISAADWVFLWQICFTGGGRVAGVAAHRSVRVWVTKGLLTRRQSFISRESKWWVASGVRRRTEVVYSVCLSSLFVGLPLHHASASMAASELTAAQYVRATNFHCDVRKR